MRTALLRLLPFLFVPVTFGCDVGGIFGTSTSDELATARDLWDSRLVETYEIDFQRSSCECLPESTTPVRIRVNTDVVESGVELPDSAPLPAEQLDFYLTVDQLFDRIEAAIEGDPYRFEAEYDPDFGFPLAVSWDQDYDVADDEIEYTMGNLIVITTYPKNPSPR